MISGAELQTVKNEQDDSFSTAPTSPTAHLASNVGDLKDVGELTGKSVKELREICKAKGIDASTCTDKGDLVDLITSKEDEQDGTPENTHPSGTGAFILEVPETGSLFSFRFRFAFFYYSGPRCLPHVLNIFKEDSTQWTVHF